MSVWHPANPIDLQAMTALGSATMPGFLCIEFTEIGDDWLKARMPAHIEPGYDGMMLEFDSAAVSFHNIHYATSSGDAP